jgi:hypothetical protein
MHIHVLDSQNLQKRTRLTDNARAERHSGVSQELARSSFGYIARLVWRKIAIAQNPGHRLISWNDCQTSRFADQMQQSLCWPPLIDPRHDLLSPLNGVRDGADSRRNSRPCLEKGLGTPCDALAAITSVGDNCETLCSGIRKLRQSDNECNREWLLKNSISQTGRKKTLR